MLKRWAIIFIAAGVVLWQAGAHIFIKALGWLGCRQRAEAGTAKRYSVEIDGVNVNDRCFLAFSFFDARLIVAFCYQKDSAGNFILNHSKTQVLRETLIGIGRITEA